MASDFEPADGTTVQGAVKRRTILASAAWAAPVIAVTAVVPLAAATGVNPLVVTIPGEHLTAGGTVLVVVTARDVDGVPLPFQQVDLTLTAPSGTVLGQPSGQTDGEGQFVTTLATDTWTDPGAIVTVQAVSGPSAASDSALVLGANALGVGRNLNAVLGAGVSGDQRTPVQLLRVFPSPVKQIENGPGASYALLENGTVWSIGSNYNGHLGLGDTTPRDQWTRIPSLTGVRSVAAGGSSGYALLDDGTVKAWGGNSNGQLGDGSTTNRLEPVAVDLTGVTHISASFDFAFAAREDGTALAWGRNSYGQLGDGTKIEHHEPVLVGGASSPLTGVQRVASGFDSGYALRSDGTVRSWGRNDRGQLGDGTQVGRELPVTVSGLPGTVTQITAGGGTGYALLSDGTARAWGENISGQLGDGSLGDGSPTLRVNPVTIGPASSPLSGITLLNGGSNYAYALLSDGTIRAWGANTFGQLGIGSTTRQTLPVEVPVAHTIKGLGGSASSMFYVL